MMKSSFTGSCDICQNVALLIVQTSALCPALRAVLWTRQRHELSILKLVRSLQAVADHWLWVLLLPATLQCALTTKRSPLSLNDTHMIKETNWKKRSVPVESKPHGRSHSTHHLARRRQ